MATVTVPTTSTLPVAGGDIIAAPLNGWITNLKTFVEGNNIDENNVDYTNSDGIVVMGQAQTITGLKTFENASAAAGGVRTAAIFSIDPASGTPTDGDGVEILFQADDDEGNVATIAELEAIMTDTDNGDEDSEVKIKALVAGSAAEFMVAGTPADGSGRVVFNDASADIDFRIETNNIANGFVVDAGLDVFAFGAAAADDKFVTISPPAATHATTVDTYALHVTAGGAQTIPSGTTALVASVAIEEPNITATGTVTNAATLYIKNAPTEGGSNYALWVDDGTAKFDSTVTIADGSLTLGSTAVSATAAEINLIDGGTSRGTTAVASGDGILINDAGTMRMTNVDTVSTYFSSHSVGGSNIVTTGALNSGSITSGFGTIDTGSSTITTTGVITSGGFTIGSAVVDEAELEILDGATVTTDELNLIDGGTARGTTAVASGDGILINDAGTMRMTNVDTVSTYFSSHSVGGSNIVTVGTISSGTWQGNKVASAYLDDDTAHLGVVQTFTANKTFTGTLTVGADDTGKDVKFFGASAGAYMEWDESADQLRLMGASADATTSTGKLLLATSLTDINANDVLGKVDFQAPHEAGGTDAITIAASIQAIAQDTFSASVNATDLIFYTGHSEAATEKFRFTSQGELGVGGANYGNDGQVLTSTGAGTAPAWETPASGGIAWDGSTANGVATFKDSDEATVESNLTFDGSTLNVVGNAGVGIARTDGTLHVHTSTVSGGPTPNTAEDDLVVENNGNCGITIMAPDANDSTLCFGSTSDAVGAVLRWNHDANLLKLSTANAGDKLTFSTAADVLAMTIDASQNVGIGIAAPTQPLHVVTSSGANVLFQLNADSGENTYAARRSRGSEGSPTAIQTDDTILALGAEGYDGSNYAGRAQLKVLAAENWSGSARGTKFAFYGATAGQAGLDSDPWVTMKDGNVGIGTASPAGVGGTILDIEGAGTAGASLSMGTESAVTNARLSSISAYSGTTECVRIETGTEGGVSDAGAISFDTKVASGALTRRMTITSAGTLAVGKTAIEIAGAGSMLLANGQAYHTCDGNPVLYVRRDSSAGTAVNLYNTTTLSGTIGVNGSSASFNTSSDYRLKENVVDLTGAVNRVAQLQPHRFNFIADPDTTVDGFVAHEVSDIVPEAITGTKDEMRDAENVIVDADGNIIVENKTEAEWLAGKEPTLVSEATEDEVAVYADPIYAADTVWHKTLTVPVYQGIDQAKLVPLLTAAIQELTARVAALESA